MNMVPKIAAIAIGLMAFTSCQSSEQSIEWNDYGDDPMQSPEFMEQWMANAAPGEHHERLARLTGTWNAVGKTWANPSAEPMEWTGVSTTKMILDGHYLQENYKSEFMGQSFEGLLIQGYDNLRQEYFTIWMDNMSTGTSTSRGTRDADGVLQMKGTNYDPKTPGGRPLRTTITENGDSAVVMNMYDITMDGDEYLAFQMSYTRR